MGLGPALDPLEAYANADHCGAAREISEPTARLIVGILSSSEELVSSGFMRILRAIGERERGQLEGGDS